MERDSWRSRLNGNTNAVTSAKVMPRTGTRQTTSSDVVPQWGNRKRLRCMKIQGKDETPGPVQRSNTRFDRPVSRSEIDASKQQPSGNGYLSLRQRSHSLVPPVSHRVLRKVENSGAMRGQSDNDKRRSPNYERNNNNNNNNNNPTDKSEVSLDSKKGGGGSDLAVWPPRFMIGLTTKEKEEDFLVLKGSKLPQRPKKRAKLIQRTLNLVSPGTWLCDLTLERYEVREKKVSKKRARGLKAMSNIDSESE